MCVPKDQNLTISGDLNIQGNYSFYVLQYRPCQSYDNITKIMSADQQAAWIKNRSVSIDETPNYFGGCSSKSVQRDFYGNHSLTFRS